MTVAKLAEKENASNTDVAIVETVDLLALMGDPDELPELDIPPAFRLLLTAMLGGCLDIQALVSYGVSESPEHTQAAVRRVCLRMEAAAKIALAHQQRTAA